MFKEGLARFCTTKYTDPTNSNVVRGILFPLKPSISPFSGKHDVANCDALMRFDDNIKRTRDQLSIFTPRNMRNSFLAITTKFWRNVF